MKIKCNNCNKDIERCYNKSKRFKNNFCSRKCFCEYRKKNHKKTYVNCKNCNKKFRTFNCYLKRNKLHFCSKKCEGKYKSYDNTRKCCFRIPVY